MTMKENVWFYFMYHYYHKLQFYNVQFRYANIESNLEINYLTPKTL